MKRFLVISMFALLTVSGAAHSKTVMVLEFVGHVTHIFTGDESALALAPGAIFSGIVRFDPELPDQDPFSDRFGEYEPLGPGHVNVGPDYLAVFSGSGGRIDVINDLFFGDEFEVTVGGFFQQCNGITGPDFAGRNLCEFRLQLIDEDGLALDSDALPLSLDVEQFENTSLVLEFRERDFSTAAIIGRIDSITIFPTVPEPSTLGLLGLGLLGLGVMRRSAG